MSNTTIESMAMEALIFIRSEQPAKDRLHYFDAALESIAVDNKGNLLQKLYDSMIKKSNIDFGVIPLSKGDFTAFKEYQTVTDAIGSLTELLKGKTCREFDLAVKLNDMLISCRADFEFGFKFDIEIIKLIYNVLVFTLLDMINLCIMGYVNYLKDTKAIEITFGKIEPSKLFFVNVADGFVAIHESGEWAKFMKTFKKNPAALNGRSFIDAIFGDRAANSILSRNAKSSGIAGKVGDFIKHIPKPIKIAIVAIGSIILLIWLLRTAVGAYFNASAKLNEKLKVMKEFTEANMKLENDPNAYAKQEKLANRLGSASNFIEAKILRVNNESNKDLKELSKELTIQSMTDGEEVGSSEDSNNGDSVTYIEF